MPRALSETPGNVAAASREAFAAWVAEDAGGRVFGQVLMTGDIKQVRSHPDVIAAYLGTSVH